MPTVFIAMPLRRFTGGQATVQEAGATLRELVERLESRFPGIKERLVDADDPDRLPPGLSAIVDGEATVLGLRQPLGPESEVHFLPAIAGGRSGASRSPGGSHRPRPKASDGSDTRREAEHV